MKMDLIDYRLDGLKETLDGYEKTGVPLVAFDGKEFYPSGAADDPGIYYIVPKIASLFHLPLERAIDTFFMSLLAISAVSAVAGTFLLFRGKIEKIIALSAILIIFLVTYRVGDLYSVPPALVLGLIPPCLLFARAGKETIPFFIYLFIAGIAAGSGNYLRVHSGTGIMIFIISFLCLHPSLRGKRGLRLGAALVAGIVAANLFVSHQLNKRDDFLANGHGKATNAITQNTFWHSFYLGFGYITNPFVAEYADRVAFEKVASQSPGTEPFSPKYEAILKRESIELIASHPYFAIQTFAAKGGVIAFFFLLFANLGIPAAIYRPLPRSIVFPLLATTAFYALPGLLVVPYHQYLLGFFASSSLYGVLHMNGFLEKLACGTKK